MWRCRSLGCSIDWSDVGWRLAGDEADHFGSVNEYLSYLANRNYLPLSVRAYGFGLLAFCRSLADEDLDVSAVTTDVLLRFLAACRQKRVGGRAGGPMWSVSTGRGPTRCLRRRELPPTARL